MLLAFINDLQQEVDTLNTIGKAEGNHADLKEELSEFVEFHATVKELSFNFGDLFHINVTRW